MHSLQEWTLQYHPNMKVVGLSFSNMLCSEVAYCSDVATTRHHELIYIFKSQSTVLFKTHLRKQKKLYFLTDESVNLL